MQPHAGGINNTKAKKIAVKDVPMTSKRFARDISIGALSGLLGGLALRHDRLLELCAKLVGKFVKTVIAVDLNSLFGGVQDHMAFAAPKQVIV